MWFDYPIHKLDTDGILKDIEPEGEYYNSKNSPWKKNFKNKKSPEQRRQESNISIETAFSGSEENGKCSVKSLAEYMGISEKTMRRKLKTHGGFWIEDGECGLK